MRDEDKTQEQWEQEVALWSDKGITRVVRDWSRSDRKMTSLIQAIINQRPDVEMYRAVIHDYTGDAKTKRTTLHRDKRSDLEDIDNYMDLKCEEVQELWRYGMTTRAKKYNQHKVAVRAILNSAPVKELVAGLLHEREMCQSA